MLISIIPTFSDTMELHRCNTQTSMLRFLGFSELDIIKKEPFSRYFGNCVSCPSYYRPICLGNHSWKCRTRKDTGNIIEIERKQKVCSLIKSFQN